ncbi:MAG: hypothetical protein ACRCTR_02700 [Actinomycetota bacterium]
MREPKRSDVRRVMKAQEAAAAIQPGSAVPWRVLELAAFSRYPKVQRFLDPRAQYHRRPTQEKLRFALAIPLMLFLVALFLMPVAGFVTLMGDRFPSTPLPDASAAVPVAGGLFLAGMPLLLASAVTWFQAGRPIDPLRRTHAWMTAGLGAISAIAAYAGSSAQEFDDGELWTLVIVVSALTGLTFAVVLHSSKKTAPKSGRAVTSAATPRQRVTSEVARLSEGQRALIRDDLVTAIVDLERRGVITADEATAARGAELGLLPVRMSQPLRSV